MKRAYGVLFLGTTALMILLEFVCSMLWRGIEGDILILHDIRGISVGYGAMECLIFMIGLFYFFSAEIGELITSLSLLVVRPISALLRKASGLKKSVN